MKSASELIEKFDGHIASPRYDSEGKELISSRARRAVEAYAKQKALETTDPRAAADRRDQIAAGEAQQRAVRVAEHECRFWNEMPSALRKMGLLDQELEAIAGMDESWGPWLAVQTWIGTKSLSLTIGGDAGSGKTIAAARMLCECKEYYRTESFEGWFWRPNFGRFVKASELARCSYYDQNDKLYLERLGLVKWLVLDDLGAEQVSDTWTATLFELFDTRARNGVRTVITTNLSSETMRKRYDNRLMRRLKDFGEFISAKKPTIKNLGSP